MHRKCASVLVYKPALLFSCGWLLILYLMVQNQFDNFLVRLEHVDFDPEAIRGRLSARDTRKVIIKDHHILCQSMIVVCILMLSLSG